MKKYLPIILCISICIQSNAQEVWSLEKCIQYGLDRNILLKQAEYNVAGTTLNLKESQMQMLPNLNANLNSGIRIGRNIDPTTNSFITENIIGGNYGISTGVLLYNAGSLRNTIKMNKALHQASQKDYERSVNDYSLQVAANYLSVLLAEERVNIAKKNLELSSQQTKQLKKLVEIGSRSAADALEMESAEARSQQTLAATTTSYEQALMQLKMAMRYDLNSDLRIEKISDDQLRNIENESYTASNLYGIALKNQPIIKSTELKYKAATLGTKVAHSRYFPTISGFGNMDSRYSDAARIPTEFGLKTETINGRVNGVAVSLEIDQPTITNTKVISFGDQFDQFLGYNFGIGASIPIFNNYSATAAVKRSQINKSLAELDLTTQKENLNSSIIQAVANVKLAIQELGAAQKSTDLAKLVNENTQKKYNIGSANNFELTTARTNYENAEISLTIAKYDLLFKQKILDLYAGKKIQ